MSIPTEQLDPISRRSLKRASRKAHQTVNVNAPSTGPPSAEPLRDHDKEHQERLIAERECRAISGWSRAQRWRLERDGKFPRRLRLGPHTVRWRLSEILAWIADLPAASPEQHHAASTETDEPHRFVFVIRPPPELVRAAAAESFKSPDFLDYHELRRKVQISEVLEASNARI